MIFSFFFKPNYINNKENEVDDKQVTKTKMDMTDESFINGRITNDMVSTNTLFVRPSVLLSICPDNPFDTLLLNKNDRRGEINIFADDMIYLKFVLLGIN